MNNLARIVSLALLTIAGCRCTQPSAPVDMTDEEIAKVLAGATRIAAGDLDGDGRPELVAVDDRSLRVIGPDGRTRATMEAPGGVQVLRVADVDGDGTGEILAGWGRSRAMPRAPARASLYRLKGDELVETLLRAPDTERQEIVEILPVPGGQLLVAHFESKYQVRIERVRPAAPASLETVASIRMATSLAYGDVDGDGAPDLVVGRLYGDPQEAPGDAFVLRPDGTRVPIPVTGGVRAIALADLDGKGRQDILLADGWDRDYGRLARALLSRATWTGEAFRTELVEESAGQFVFWGIVPADLDGDGSAEITTRGSGQVQVLTGGSGRMRGSAVAAECSDSIAVELDGRPGAELILLCGGKASVVHGGAALPR